MRIAGAAIVRNEADIVEPFVRHNLGILDELTVVDHGSFDGTSEILAALVAEGLPLTVLRDDAPAMFQSKVTTRNVRALLARGVDFVFALDADEFIKARDPALLRAVLAGLPEGLHAVAHWQTYVPDFAGAPAAHPLAAARRRLASERHGLHKVIVARHFAAEPAAVVASGSHIVLPDTDTDPRIQPVRHARLAAEVVAIAHLPVRSAAQLMRKASISWLSRRAAHGGRRNLSFHLRDLYEEMRDGAPPSAGRLAEIAANYGIARQAWLPVAAIALVEDPLPTSAPIRYAHLARTDIAHKIRELADKLRAMG